MVTFKNVSRTWAVRYFGRVCDIQEYRVDASKYGRRVVVRRWRDNGRVELSAMKGDGRTAKFTMFEQDVALPVGVQLEDVARAVKAMADRHFA